MGETEWSADGTKWLPAPVIDGADDGDRWHWKVQGTAESHGTIRRGWEGEGIVQARTSAEALVWLAAERLRTGLRRGIHDHYLAREDGDLTL
jgi:hypothetical protein